MLRPLLLLGLTTLLLTPTMAISADSCRLKYPIVLSHHFGLRTICPASWTPAQCLQREGDNVAKYCADWDDDAGCQQWHLPADESHLPPRIDNLFDPNLKRTSNIAGYHRYFSKAIVDRLEQCGNEVFIADKPAYASYQLRSASLRRTVLQALDATGAEKVVIIGASQGVQDARFMAAVQPVDPAQPQLGNMGKHVAAIVSLAGEHRGAEIATIGITGMYFTNYRYGDGWLDPDNGAYFWSFEEGQSLNTDLQWREVGSTTTDAELFQQPLVLTEGYDPYNPMEYDLDRTMQFRSFLHGLAALSSQYMRTDYPRKEAGWDALRNALGMEETRWADLVNAENEACNGVGYYSYSARIRRWDYKFWGDATFYLGVTTFFGANDGYTTMASQNFDKIGYDACADGKSNFEHIKTLDGHPWSHGYYHNFFTGRNPHYGPKAPWLQERAPYKGDAADFYEQVMRDLIQRGY